MLLDKPPIKPTDVVVLTVSIIVAFLRPTNFITTNQHWHTLAKQQRAQHIFDLAGADRIDRFLACWSFSAVIVADVVIVTVAIIFPIGHVVFLFVRHKVVHGETIMARDQVDTTKGWSAIVLVQVTAAG